MDKFTLVTGASKGIGKAIATKYAEQKHNLLLIARDRKLLQKLALQLQNDYQIKALTLSLDLTSLEAIRAIKSFCAENNMIVENLVNNAGFGDYKNFAEEEKAKISGMINLNILSLTLLAREFLDDIIKTSGRIILISSTAGYQPTPLMAVYGASKAFVTSFGLSLNEEIKPLGASVTVICPGNTTTDFIEVAGTSKTNFAKINQASAEEVAAFTYAKAKNRVPIATHGLRNALVAQLPRFFSKSMQAQLAKQALK